MIPNIESLRDNLFLIPIEENKYIIYAPVHGAAFSADFKTKDLLERYILGENISGASLVLDNYIRELEKQTVTISTPNININDRAVIILSQRCNLACSYCFASKAHSQERMTEGMLFKIIDYIFSRNTGNKKRFEIIGGGEPLVEWDLCEKGITYIRSHSKEAHIGITTNATLFDDRKIAFLKENNVKISVSFEILPDIQDKQRGFQNPKISSFEKANYGINKLCANGFDIRFRTTITPLNVSRMAEMVRFSALHYPSVKRLHFEPVSGEIENEVEFYNLFTKNYFDAKAVSDEYEIRTSILNSIERCVSRFCNNEQCFTPDGTIVSCHRVSSPRDSEYERFKIGTFSEEDVSVEHDKLAMINQLSVHAFKKCETCFAKWNCAGGCLYNRFTYTEEQLRSRCDFTRTLLTTYLRNIIKEV